MLFCNCQLFGDFSEFFVCNYLLLGSLSKFVPASFCTILFGVFFVDINVDRLIATKIENVLEKINLVLMNKQLKEKYWYL